MSKTEASSSQEQTKNVTIIILKTSDGRYVGSKPTYDAPVTASDGATDFFELTELGSGTVALKAFRSGKYVSAHPETGLAANREEIGPCETLTLIQREEGTVAFQLSDGIHYLSAQPGNDKAVVASAVSVGPNELFNVERYDYDEAALSASACCCGPRPTSSQTASETGGVMWDNLAHIRIVEKAVELLVPHQKNYPDVSLFLSSIWSQADFKDAVFRGLKDADYDPKYTEKLPFLYKNHFFEPHRKVNYNNELNHALADGQRYFNLSVHYGRRMLKLGSTTRVPEARKADAQTGYNLGLALHFFTDLTQPMHAANYTTADDPLYWHSKFETYTDKVRTKYLDTLVEPLYPDYLDNIGSKYSCAGDFLWWIANHSNSVWSNKLWPATQDNVKEILRYIATGEVPNDIPWLNNSLKDSLSLAPRETARYLAYWVHCIQQPLNLSQKKWYYIQESTRDEWVRNTLGNKLERWEQSEGGDDRLFFVLFNRDGTVSFGSKAKKDHLWRVSEDKGYGYINLMPKPDSAMRPEYTFRVVPTLNKKVWIYESSQNEAVSIEEPPTNSRHWYGELIRWRPIDGIEPSPGESESHPHGYKRDRNTQLFTFVEAGIEFTSKDLDELQKLYPGYGEMPWWGDITWSRSSQYGGSGGLAFCDITAAPAKVIGIKSIKIRHGGEVDAIQVEYRLSDGRTHWADKHGGDGGGESIITLEEGETITRLDVRSEARVDQLTFTTKNRSGKEVTYGPYGGSGGQGPFSIVGEVKGFFGRSAGMLDAIGVYLD